MEEKQVESVLWLYLTTNRFRYASVRIFCLCVQNSLNVKNYWRTELYSSLVVLQVSRHISRTWSWPPLLARRLPPWRSTPLRVEWIERQHLNWICYGLGGRRKIFHCCSILFPLSGSLSGEDRTVDPAAIPRSISVAMFALIPHAKKTIFCPTGRCTLHSREYQDQTANWKPRNIWVRSYFPEQADYYGCPAVP